MNITFTVSDRAIEKFKHELQDFYSLPSIPNHKFRKMIEKNPNVAWGIKQDWGTITREEAYEALEKLKFI